MNGSLYARIYDWDNLLLAHRRASRGKRGREPAACFEYHLEDNLVALHDELRCKTYRPGPYDSFYIHEPKRRLITLAASCPPPLGEGLGEGEDVARCAIGPSPRGRGSRAGRIGQARPLPCARAAAGAGTGHSLGKLPICPTMAD